MLNRVIEGDFPCKQFVLELEDTEGERGWERKGAGRDGGIMVEGWAWSRALGTPVPALEGARHQGNENSQVSLAMILMIKYLVESNTF